jgi:hypothetical protein
MRKSPLNGWPRGLYCHEKTPPDLDYSAVTLLWVSEAFGNGEYLLADSVRDEWRQDDPLGQDKGKYRFSLVVICPQKADFSTLEFCADIKDMNDKLEVVCAIWNSCWPGRNDPYYREIWTCIGTDKKELVRSCRLEAQKEWNIRSSPGVPTATAV